VFLTWWNLSFVGERLTTKHNRERRAAKFVISLKQQAKNSLFLCDRF
jgi:hypothetical protein